MRRVASGIRWPNTGPVDQGCDISMALTGGTPKRCGKRREIPQRLEVRLRSRGSVPGTHTWRSRGIGGRPSELPRSQGRTTRLSPASMGPGHVFTGDDPGGPLRWASPGSQTSGPLRSRRKRAVAAVRRRAILATRSGLAFAISSWCRCRGSASTISCWRRRASSACRVGSMATTSDL
jgi:hypothetical protein